MGITLLFGCRSSAGYWGMLNDYVIQINSLALLGKKAVTLGQTEAPHFSSDENGACTFIGLYDAYHVDGPLQTGAILGHTSYWSRKTRSAAARRILPDYRLMATLDLNRKSKESVDYLFRAVYFLSSPSVPRNRRRTVKVWLLVSTQSKKQLIELAKETAGGRKTKTRLLKALSDTETPDELQFCGFTEVRKAFDSPVRIGSCFLSNVKHFNKFSRIQALIKKRGG